MKKSCLLFLAILISVYYATGQEAATKRFEQGIEVITNPIKPCPTKGEQLILRLEKELAIDADRKDLRRAGLKDIWQFDIDSEGNIYVVSSFPDGKSILKISPKGNLGRVIGKQGQSRGEFTQPGVVRISRDDEIIVPDAGINVGKVLFFNKEGEFIKEIAKSSIRDLRTGLPNETPRETQIGDVYPLENGYYLTQWILSYYTELDHYNPLVLCNSKWQELKELDSHKVPGFRHAKVKSVSGVFPRFSWSVSKQRIYVGNDEHGYEIHVYDLQGKLTRKIQKVYRPVPIGEKYKETIMTIFKNAPWKQKIYFPEAYPAFQYIFSDDDGRLYVMTYEVDQNSGNYLYDIFNSDGVFIGRTCLGNFGTPDYWDAGTDLPLEVRAKRNRLYCNQMKRNGQNELVVYKMLWSH